MQKKPRARLTTRDFSQRTLTPEERVLVRSVFGDAIDLDRIAIHKDRWWLFQPKKMVVAPNGDIWCHPGGSSFRNCFATSTDSWRAFFIHEMTHVWQVQHKGRWFLPLRRTPFSKFRYELEHDKPFADYGVEQQAEIVKHAYMMRSGIMIAGKPPLGEYEKILPFRPA